MNVEDKLSFSLDDIIKQEKPNRRGGQRKQINRRRKFGNLSILDRRLDSFRFQKRLRRQTIMRDDNAFEISSFLRRRKKFRHIPLYRRKNPDSKFRFINAQSRFINKQNGRRFRRTRTMIVPMIPIELPRSRRETLAIRASVRQNQRFLTQQQRRPITSLSRHLRTTVFPVIESESQQSQMSDSVYPSQPIGIKKFRRRRDAPFQRISRRLDDIKITTSLDEVPGPLQAQRNASNFPSEQVSTQRSQYSTTNIVTNGPSNNAARVQQSLSSRFS